MLIVTNEHYTGTKLIPEVKGEDQNITVLTSEESWDVTLHFWY